MLHRSPEYETIEADASEFTPRMIAAAELAKLLNISTRTLWRLRSAGKLPPPVRLGGAIRWLLTDIEGWLANRCSFGNNCDNAKRRK